MSSLKKLVKAGAYVSALSAIRFLTKKSNEKPLWLISERGFDARDNGYWFFKYMTENHKEIESVYVVDKGSADYGKVSSLGETVQFGSWDHLCMMANADALISTHDCGWSPDMVVFHHLMKHGLIKLRGKIALIQHGVNDKVIPWYFREECKPDVFVVSTEDEQENILKNYGQPESCVKLTGLPRYDNLKTQHEEDNMLLIMPTWRQDLKGLSQEEFEQSEYWKQYKALMEDQRLLKFAEDNGISIVFYPHIEMQCFVKPAENGVVRIATMDTDDVQNLLMRCKLLITDYSSVAYDVFYMHKPVIFFQFDKEKIGSGHYGKYEAQTWKIGTALITRPAVVDAVMRLWGRKIEWKDNNGLFKYDDQNNCERVYEAIRDCFKG